MTVVQKRRLLETAIKKREVSDSRKIESYRPHDGSHRGMPDDGQAPFHKNNQRIRILTGGNQSGKTLGGLVESIRYALGIHPDKRIKVPNRGRIIAGLGFEEGANQNIVPKLMEWIPKGSFSGSPRRNQAGVPVEFRFVNGSVINILSAEQDKKVFEGWTGDWAWIDEPCPKHCFEGTRRGLLKSRGDLWFTMTPLSEPWVFNDLYHPAQVGERDDVGLFTIDMWDNCIENGGYLPRESIEEYIKDLDVDSLEARIHGKFKFLTGRVYPDYDPKIHVVPQFDIPRDWDVWEGIDPHLRKEHAYCQWAISPEGVVYVCNEIWEKLTIPQLADEIHRLRRGKRIVRTVIDSSSETPDSIYRVTPRKMLQDYGISTKLASKHGNVMPGILKMREMLKLEEVSTGDKLPRFFVMDHCKRHQKEFLNYVFDTRDTEYLVKDSPRKIYDDMMDLDRYFMVEDPLRVRERSPVLVNEYRYG